MPIIAAPARPLRAGSLAAAALVLLSGCGDAGTIAAEDLGLSAVAVYGRHAAVRGKVDVRVDNDGPRPVSVEQLQIRHPMFAPLPPTSRQTRLPDDGDPRIVPVPFGEPRCDTTDDSGAVVVLGVRTERGLEDVVVPLADGEPGLVRAHRLACGAAAVRAAVDVSLGPPWSPAPAGGLRTSLRLDRRGEGQVRVTELSGTILFSVDRRGDGDLLRLPAGQDASTVEVVVSATRCDPHALTESKRSFTFPVYASLDGAEPVLLQVTVDGDGRRALQQLLEDTCPALGGGKG